MKEIATLFPVNILKPGKQFQVIIDAEDIDYTKRCTMGEYGAPQAAVIPQ